MNDEHATRIGAELTPGLTKALRLLRFKHDFENPLHPEVLARLEKLESEAGPGADLLSLGRYLARVGVLVRDAAQCWRGEYVPKSESTGPGETAVASTAAARVAATPGGAPGAAEPARRLPPGDPGAPARPSAPQPITGTPVPRGVGTAPKLKGTASPVLRGRPTSFAHAPVVVSLPEPPPLPDSPPPPRVRNLDRLDEITVRSLPEIERALDEVHEEWLALTKQVQQMPSDEESREELFLRLKIAACRLRRCQDEMELRVDTPDHLERQAKASMQALIAVVEREYSGRFVIPFRRHLQPEDPVSWEVLEERYEGLLLAMRALAWRQGRAAELGAGEQKSLLEAVVANQQLFHRYVEQEFPEVTLRDDQQRRIWEQVIRVNNDLGLHLAALRRETSTLELTRLAENLLDIQSRLEQRLAGKYQQADTTACVVNLVTQPGFGLLPQQDALALREAAAKALEAGVPASNKVLRDAVLPWVQYLVDYPPTARLLDEVKRERRRRGLSELPEPAAPEPVMEEEEAPDSGDLDEATWEKLDAVLPFTRGRTMVFVGGHAQEERRRTIESVLELKALHWPETKPQDAWVKPSTEALVRSSDFTVVLIRWSRTEYKRLKEVAEANGHRYLLIPKGLGLAQVIQNFYDQLAVATRKGNGGT